MYLRLSTMAILRAIYRKFQVWSKVPRLAKTMMPVSWLSSYAHPWDVCRKEMWRFLGWDTMATMTSVKSRNLATLYSSWWFQPLWKIFVKMGIFPNFWGENKKYLKPPPSIRWVLPPCNSSLTVGGSRTRTFARRHPLPVKTNKTWKLLLSHQNAPMEMRKLHETPQITVLFPNQQL